jgi:hypothetical protein
MSDSPSDQVHPVRVHTLIAAMDEPASAADSDGDIPVARVPTTGQERR